MSTAWQNYLKRWTRGGFIDAATADRIRAFETEQAPAAGLRWPVLLAVGLGGVLLGAGVLLFVAAHWDGLASAERFAVVLALVAAFHVAGASVAERFPAMSSTLHAVGTVCLGAGIFLAGQIFHLREHWPGGVMLWTLGAWAGWALLRDWPQAALVAALTPFWLGSEWIEATRGMKGAVGFLAQGSLLLAITYFTALLPDRESPVRRMLMWVGGLCLIPSVLAVATSSARILFDHGGLPPSRVFLGRCLAFGLPLLMAAWLRRSAAWMNVVAAIWVVVLGSMNSRSGEGLGLYAMCAAGFLGLVAWGLAEERKERINIGIAGFALTVLAFYFSNVMDKLGRSASLISLGFIFLLGGWLLEKARRRLVAQVESIAP